jgi:hypothetical protein
MKIKGTMNENMFSEHLAKPFHLGGVGIHPEEVDGIARRIFNLIRYSIDVKRFRQEVGADNAFMHQQKFVERLLTYLNEEVGFHLTEDQNKILRECVADRVGGITDAEKFAERLLLEKRLGGAEIEERVAYMISVHMEKLIAQGGYIILPNNQSYENKHCFLIII